MTQLKTYQTTLHKQILMIIESSHEPLSVPEIIMRLGVEAGLKPNKTSVYRQVDKMEEAKLIHSFKVPVSDAKLYELNPEGLHAHLFCNNCRSVQCLDLDEVSFDEAGEALNFEINKYNLQIFGHCGNCR